jgi:hypothetical protein
MKALKEQQANMIADKKAQSVGKNKLPVKLTIKDYTFDGQIIIEFNQALEIPSILKSEGRRILLGLKDIDLSKIVSLTIIQMSEVSSDNLKYFMSATKWNSEQLII